MAIGEVRFKPGQLIPVKAGAATIAPSAKTLTFKQRRALRVEQLKDYIRSKPAGTPIKNTVLAEMLGMTEGNVGTMRNQSWFRKEFDFYSAEGKYGYVYTIKNDVKITKFEPTYKAPALFTPDQIKAKAKEFAWEHDSDSLRGFISWLDKDQL